MVSRQLLNAGAWVWSQVSTYEICVGQSGTRSVFFPQYFGFPLSLSFHQCSIMIYILFLRKGQTATSGNISKSMLFRRSKSIGQKNTSRFFFLSTAGRRFLLRIKIDDFLFLPKQMLKDSHELTWSRSSSISDCFM
jgi:hypothetical protein